MGGQVKHRRYQYLSYLQLSITLLISRGAILNIKFMTSFAESNLSSWADFITLDPCLQFWCTWYLVISHILLAAVVE